MVTFTQWKIFVYIIIISEKLMLNNTAYTNKSQKCNQ